MVHSWGLVRSYRAPFEPLASLGLGLFSLGAISTGGKSRRLAVSPSHRCDGPLYQKGGCILATVQGCSLGGGLGSSWLGVLTDVCLVLSPCRGTVCGGLVSACSGAPFSPRHTSFWHQSVQYQVITL